MGEQIEKADWDRVASRWDHTGNHIRGADLKQTVKQIGSKSGADCEQITSRLRADADVGFALPEAFGRHTQGAGRPGRRNDVGGHRNRAAALALIAELDDLCLV